MEAILNTVKPMEAAALGRDPNHPIRKDWDSPVSNWGGLEGSLVDDGRGPVKAIERVKDLIMYEVVLSKFTQHSGIRTVLLSTGTLGIVENAIHDPYWGIGCSGIGVNRLGKVLMLVREQLSKQP